jgi:hypothetical protein
MSSPCRLVVAALALSVIGLVGAPAGAAPARTAYDPGHPCGPAAWTFSMSRVLRDHGGHRLGRVAMYLIDSSSSPDYQTRRWCAATTLTARGRSGHVHLRLVAVDTGNGPLGHVDSQSRRHHTVLKIGPVNSTEECCLYGGYRFSWRHHGHHVHRAVAAYGPRV